MLDRKHEQFDSPDKSEELEQNYAPISFLDRTVIEGRLDVSGIDLSVIDVLPSLVQFLDDHPEITSLVARQCSLYFANRDFRHNKTLTSLDLSNNLSVDINALMEMKNLTYLNLSQLSISDDEIVRIAKHQKLETLILKKLEPVLFWSRTRHLGRQEGLYEKIIHFGAAALAENRQLRHLDLSENYLTDFAVNQLLRNRQLKTFAFDGGKIRREGIFWGHSLVDNDPGIVRLKTLGERNSVTEALHLSITMHTPLYQDLANIVVEYVDALEPDAEVMPTGSSVSTWLLKCAVWMMAAMSQLFSYCVTLFSQMPAIAVAPMPMRPKPPESKVHEARFDSEDIGSYSPIFQRPMIQSNITEEKAVKGCRVS